MTGWLRMKKRAGMELSINAIVILIIAMVVLGIGILFIRRMFGKAQTTTFKALTAQETKVSASADRPFVLDKEITASNSDPSAVMQVSVYNPHQKTARVFINRTRCVDKTGNDITGSVSFTEIGYYSRTATGAEVRALLDNSPSINQGAFASFQAILTINNIGSHAKGEPLSARSLQFNSQRKMNQYGTGLPLLTGSCFRSIQHLPQ